MNLYLTDGSEEGFFTAAFRACTDKGCLVTSAKTFQPPLGARMLEVAAEADKAEREGFSPAHGAKKGKKHIILHNDTV